MRVRTPDRERPRTAAEAGPTTASRLGGLARHLLTAIGLLTVTYVVLRVLGPRDDVPIQSVDEVQEEMEDVLPDEIRSRATDAVPGDRSIDTIRNRVGATVPDDITETTIDGPRSEASEFDPGVEPSSETDEGGGDDVTGLDESSEAGTDEPERDETSGDMLDETATNADYADDRSDEEIAERTESDVQDEPAEPGEMAVGEDVAEDLVDDDLDSGDDEKSEE
ncbi:hypothetical protein ACFR99_08700 [Haloarchaeobius amylolyticus]|uniref:Uncharacterized protein n=1 Tax=Haloarchaeobius amylolyticus TaxID=1198296 RepID=A0ABD6BGA3_9EURY